MYLIPFTRSTSQATSICCWQMCAKIFDQPRLYSCQGTGFEFFELIIWHQFVYKLDTTTTTTTTATATATATATTATTTTTWRICICVLKHNISIRMCYFACTKIQELILINPQPTTTLNSTTNSHPTVWDNLDLATLLSRQGETTRPMLSKAAGGHGSKGHTR